MTDKEYIDRQALLTTIKTARNQSFLGKVAAAKLEKFVKSIPAADVAPVVHGKNNYNGNPVDGFCCSVCSFYTEDVGRLEYDGDTDDMCLYENTFDFCPNCGAKMDLEGLKK